MTPRASELISEADRQRVAEAVQRVEAVTSAEILPVIATSSGRYDRAEDIVGIWFALVALTAAWILYPQPSTDVGSWQSPAPYWQLAALLLAVVAGFFVGAALATRVDWLRRLVTPRQQMRDEVSLRARSLFFDQRVHHTAGRSGLLLYVSLYEHMSAVIADQAATEVLGQQRLERICGELTDRLRSSDPATALCETIASLSAELASALPRDAQDVNELSDALVIAD